MARLVEAGADVRYVAFSIATRSLPEGFAPDTLAREVREATAELGIPAENLTVHDFDVRTFPDHRQEILELLIEIWNDWQPDCVFQPSLHDVHQDHQTIANEGLRAFKRTTILGYEIPWNNFDFSYQAYFALEQRHVERKVAALEKYASQQHRRYANAEYVWNVARTHGDQREPRVRRGVPGVPRGRLAADVDRPCDDATASALSTSPWRTWRGRSTYYTEAIGLDVLGLGDGEASLGSAGGVELLHLVEEPGARPGRRLHRPLPLRAARAPSAATSRGWMQHAIARPRSADRRVRSLRQRGALPARPRPPRDRDLRRPATASLGRAGRSHRHVAPRRRRPARHEHRAGGRRCRHGHPDGPRPPARLRRRGERSASIATCVGFDLMAQLGDQAAFLSAGGYHHQLGANTWESRGAAPAPRGHRDGCTHFTIIVPDAHEGERIAAAVGGEFRDPSGNAFVLSLAGLDQRASYEQLRRQRPCVHDHERLRRARQGDVELAQLDHEPARPRRRGRTRGPSPAGVSAPGTPLQRSPAGQLGRASSSGTITASRPSGVPAARARIRLREQVLLRDPVHGPEGRRRCGRRSAVRRRGRSCRGAATPPP